MTQHYFMQSVSFTIKPVNNNIVAKRVDLKDIGLEEESLIYVEEKKDSMNFFEVLEIDESVSSGIEKGSIVIVAKDWTTTKISISKVEYVLIDLKDISGVLKFNK